LLEDEMKKELEAASERYETAVSDIDTTTVRPLKRDVVVNAFLVVWLPE
jgi:hypothetical protein